MAKKIKFKKQSKVKKHSIVDENRIDGDEGLDESGQPRPTHKPGH